MCRADLAPAALDVGVRQRHVETIKSRFRVAPFFAFLFTIGAGAIFVRREHDWALLIVLGFPAAAVAIELQHARDPRGIIGVPGVGGVFSQGFKSVGSIEHPEPPSPRSVRHARRRVVAQGQSLALRIPTCETHGG